MIPNMLLLLIAFTLVLPGAVSGRTYGTDYPVSDTIRTDRDFVQTLAHYSIFEKQLARQALNLSANRDVKKFAEITIRDNIAILNSLKSISIMRGIPVSGKMDDRHQYIFDDMVRSRSDTFDRDFIDIMITDQRIALALLHEKSGKADPEINEWIKKALPVFQDHITMAEELRSHLRNR